MKSRRDDAIVADAARSVNSSKNAATVTGPKGHQSEFDQVSLILGLFRLVHLRTGTLKMQD